MCVCVCQEKDANCQASAADEAGMLLAQLPVMVSSERIHDGFMNNLSL